MKEIKNFKQQKPNDASVDRSIQALQCNPLQPNLLPTTKICIN